MTDQDLALQVEAWARSHRDELVRDLIRLVNIRSVSEEGEGGYPFGTGCKKAADELMSMGRRYGLETDNVDYYCASVLLPSENENARELGILGHIDVVPEGDGWHYKPYDAFEKDGFVIGRGSSDNKGAVIMSLFVLRFLKENGIKLNHTVRLIAGCNEESGMKDVEYYLAHRPLPDFTLNCDGAWAMCIGEKGILTADLTVPVRDGNLVDIVGGLVSNAVPSDATAILQNVTDDQLKVLAKEPLVKVERGGEAVRITAYGKAAHAMSPERGDNAIYRLYRVLTEYQLLTGEAAEKIRLLRDCFPDNDGTGLAMDSEDEVSGKTTVAGCVVSMKNGVLRQNINTRYAVTVDGDVLASCLEQRCTKLGIAVENLQNSKGRYTSVDEPIVKLLLDTCHEIMGPDNEPYVMGGGTHSRKFPRSLPYGPGYMWPKIQNPFGFPHGIDEAVPLEYLLDGMKGYVVALCRMDRFFEQKG